MVILLIQLIYNMTIFYYATLSQVQAKRIKGIYMCQRIPMTIHAHSQAGVMVGAGQGWLAPGSSYRSMISSPVRLSK